MDDYPIEYRVETTGFGFSYRDGFSSESDAVVWAKEVLEPGTSYTIRRIDSRVVCTGVAPSFLDNLSDEIESIIYESGVGECSNKATARAIIELVKPHLRAGVYVGNHPKETSDEKEDPPMADPDRWQVMDDNEECYGVFKSKEGAMGLLKELVKIGLKDASDLFVIEFEDGKRVEGAYTVNSEGKEFFATYD